MTVGISPDYIHLPNIQIEFHSKATTYGNTIMGYQIYNIFVINVNHSLPCQNSLKNPYGLLRLP
ncbi:hypothetical protein DERP_001210 [Dermatophagoides pteronyssinus]|uniref:Uncharacterized protein n=1 Tax=Dermatophagoides pteronyssinus TaxID=6956 RepID=A0ABQ8JDU8_DERPT|nr:hypothetical protein DERP_001210 [Dermatophagoides pteronyssinus]